jgi:hypothetical protein
MNHLRVALSPYPPAGVHTYAASDELDASELADRIAAELLLNDPRRLAVTVEISRPCAACEGTGHRPRQRKKFFPDPCRAPGCDAGRVLFSAESKLRPATDADLDRRLASIRVLWRQPDTLTLWGVPYEMKAHVGQQPYDLWRARRDHVPPRSGAYGAPALDLSDWIYLGEPGWFGACSREEIASIGLWLASLPNDAIPGGPCEWTRLSDFGR